VLENNYNRNGKGKFFQILLQWRTKMKTTNQQPTTVGTSPKWKQPMISTGCVLLASLLMSVNIKSFVRAGNLIPGGFTGLSLLLQRTAETFFIAIFGDQYCIECDTGDYRFSDDREKVYLIYGTDDRTELFSGRSDPGNADYI